jgi:hypothetical protein
VVFSHIRTNLFLDGPTLEPRKGNVDCEYKALDPVQKGNYKKSWSYYIF